MATAGTRSGRQCQYAGLTNGRARRTLRAGSERVCRGGGAAPGIEEEEREWSGLRLAPLYPGVS